MSHKMTLGIDFGGSSSKVTLLEDTGRVVAAAGREYNSYFPKPGWYKQDADKLCCLRLLLSTPGKSFQNRG